MHMQQVSQTSCTASFRVSSHLNLHLHVLISTQPVQIEPPSLEASILLFYWS